jgi:prophage regulatory protein
MRNQKSQPLDRMVGTKEMLLITGLPLSSVYDGMHAGWFPKNVKISPKRVAWKESELRHYIESRQAFQPRAPA